ncbi:hypothetical protein D3C87_2047240 [compost metagenome]
MPEDLDDPVANRLGGSCAHRDGVVDERLVVLRTDLFHCGNARQLRVALLAGKHEDADPSAVGKWQQRVDRGDGVVHFASGHGFGGFA